MQVNCFTKCHILYDRSFAYHVSRSTSSSPVMCWGAFVVCCAKCSCVSIACVAPTEPSPLRPINSTAAASECPSPYYDACNMMNPFFFIKHLPTLPDEIRNRQPALPRRTRSTPEYTLVLDLVSMRRAYCTCGCRTV